MTERRSGDEPADRAGRDPLRTQPGATEREAVPRVRCRPVELLGTDHPWRVLLMQPEGAVREALVDRLNRMGLAVVAVANRIEALRVLRREFGAAPPDLVLANRDHAGDSWSRFVEGIRTAGGFAGVVSFEDRGEVLDVVARVEQRVRSLSTKLGRHHGG